MATIWNLAVLYSSHNEGEPTQYLIRYFPVGSGVDKVSKVPSIEDGANTLMKENYEPFGASSEHGYKHINIWFRREVKKISIKREVAKKVIRKK